MKLSDFIAIVLLSLVFGSFVFWYSGKVSESGRILDEEYTIVCPKGEECYPVKK